MENKREQWGSNFGFLMAAVGSAVGLGNIWGFPYKMGANGGGVFLFIYLLLVVFVGFAVMLGELALGRKEGRGSVGAYRALSKKYTWIGYMGVASGFLILAFYCVLGGMVFKYMCSFFLEIFSPGAGFGGMGGGEAFGALIINPVPMILYYAIFMLITIVIVMGGISGGIEKFSKIAMPALAVMLLIVIIRSVTLPHAGDGIKFMFGFNPAVFQEKGFLSILKTAAGQMFFSLSLGMGNMITYGSYLAKKENLEKNSLFIPVADTLMALMAGLAVMPAVGAFKAAGIPGIDYGGGPGLLFVTLHEVFQQGMGGFIGNLFGFLFYLLVVIAAITSSISLLEVCTTFIIDKNIDKGKAPNRKMISFVMGAIIFVIGLPVALDGLGSGTAGGAVLNAGPLGSYLDFYDMLSEGLMMPLGALFMSIIIGWLLKTVTVKNEVELEGNKMKGYSFWNICFKYIVPIAMVIVLIGQLETFFGWRILG